MNTNELQKKIITKNIVNESNGATGIEAGLKNMPVRKMYEQVQYLMNNVLPQAKEKLGEKSESYLFYEALVDSLMWAILVKERYDALQTKHSFLSYSHKVLKDQLALMETELNKYITLEDLLLTQSLNTYQTTVANRIAEMTKTNNQ